MLRPRITGLEEAKDQDYYKTQAPCSHDHQHHTVATGPGTIVPSTRHWSDQCRLVTGPEQSWSPWHRWSSHGGKCQDITGRPGHHQHLTPPANIHNNERHISLPRNSSGRLMAHYLGENGKQDEFMIKNSRSV